ncbi:hypothetical protein AMELA_G00036270, partial [Ameiurus melas]
ASGSFQSPSPRAARGADIALIPTRSLFGCYSQPTHRQAVDTSSRAHLRHPCLFLYPHAASSSGRFRFPQFTGARVERSRAPLKWANLLCADGEEK